MSTTTLPIITKVTGYHQQSRLTTIFFECNLFDGRGPLNRDFQINDYEMHWYYRDLGWDKRYFPFNEFWESSDDNARMSFLFLLITDEKSVVQMSAKAKVRCEFLPATQVKSRGTVTSMQRRLAS